MLRKEDFTLVDYRNDINTLPLDQFNQKTLLREGGSLFSEAVMDFLKGKNHRNNRRNNQFMGFWKALNAIGYEIQYRGKDCSPFAVSREILAELGERTA